jgi:hypothetical protein
MPGPAVESAFGAVVGVGSDWREEGLMPFPWKGGVDCRVVGGAGRLEGGGGGGGSAAIVCGC